MGLAIAEEWHNIGILIQKYYTDAAVINKTC